MVDAVCRALENVGDPARAEGQQAYMKSAMPFRGVTALQLKATLRPLLADPAYRLVGCDDAARRVGPILRAHPETEAERMRSWATADNMWVRRVAILSQLSSKDETDRQLLLDCITPNLADREFFIRKAIGWSLRQYAHAGTSAADWVRRSVDQLDTRLSPLSRREALKNLG